MRAHYPSISRSLVLTATLVPACASQAADSPQAIEFFEKRIRPVLVEKCYSCHSPQAEKLKGGLLLDSRAGIRKGGETGPAIVPGNPKGSLLLSAIRYEDFEMPPNERLSEAVVEDFTKWIEMGAPDPREGTVAAKVDGIDMEAGRQHWSFQPIANPPVPQVKNSVWPWTDIDRFVLAGLEEKGLQPVANAELHELRRRIALDLTGLPPGEELPASESPSQWIDTLLASPRFGERWGRHWLDLARYAESSGSGHNVLFPLAFRYRDWVIDAINADMPYDQFVTWQLAGDLVPAATEPQRNEHLIATGFLAVGVKDLRERDTKRFRMAIADEQIDVTSRALLGLTIACAKCHDHKFDPIPTRDYYGLAGIFFSSEPLLGARRNRHTDPFASGVASLAGSSSPIGDAEVVALLKERLALTQARLKLRDERWRVLGTMKIPIKNTTAAQDELVDQQPSVQALQQEAREQEARYRAAVERYDAGLAHAAMAMRDVQPADVPIHVRGEDSQLGEIVPRGFPEVLRFASAKPFCHEQSGRLELAQWIASSDNPLTARVMANRVWQHLFGRGIVETPDDFGHTGQPPSNPALLDHLAQRLIAHDWSIKKLIREIMLSRIYQLSSRHDAKAMEVDPANRLHWRMSRRRLDSDAIFDAIRQISGELVLERPAAVIPPTPDDDRVKSMDLKSWFARTVRYRTIYQPVLRDQIPEDWRLFDFPDPELVTGQRNITTVPTQALYLMNSPFIVEHSAKTAKRLLASGENKDQIVTNAYELILNRPPTKEEWRDADKFFESFAGSDGNPSVQAVAALCQALFASAEFRYLY